MGDDRNYWEDWMRRRMSRRSVLRRVGLTGLALAGGSSLWACTSTETPRAAEPAPTAGKPASTPTPIPAAGPKRGGTLRIGVGKAAQPEDLDPHTSFATHEIYIKHIFESVVDQDNSLAYAPKRSLAESWEVVDDVTLVLKLRKGVKFHDGTEWNAQTFKFNVDRMADPEIKSPRAYVIQATKNIEYADNYTAKITLKEPMGSIFGEMSQAGFGMTTPANVAKWSSQELKRRPVGSGPFILTEYVPDDHYTLVRHKDYWQKDDKGEQLPYVDALRLVVIPEDTVRTANLTTGQIDVDADVAMKDVAKAQADPNLKVILQHGVGMRGMYWNISRPPFNNLNFRRAVKYGINREAIAKVVGLGIVKGYSGIVLPAHSWAFDPSRPVIPYDSVKAKQYLDQALAEGVGAEFSTRAASGDFMKITEMMQADLAKIGIKLNIVPEEVATSAYRYWTSFQIDSLFAGYGMLPDPYSKIYVAHHSQGFYLPERKEMGKSWDTPEGYFAKLDPLIEAANRTYDPKQRAKLLNQASDVLDDHVGFLGVFYTSYAMAVNKKVEGASWGGGDKQARFERAWLNV